MICDASPWLQKKGSSYNLYGLGFSRFDAYDDINKTVGPVSTAFIKNYTEYGLTNNVTIGFQSIAFVDWSPRNDVKISDPFGISLMELFGRVSIFRTKHIIISVQNIIRIPNVGLGPSASMTPLSSSGFDYEVRAQFGLYWGKKFFSLSDGGHNLLWFEIGHRWRGNVNYNEININIKYRVRILNYTFASIGLFRVIRVPASGDGKGSLIVMPTIFERLMRNDYNIFELSIEQIIAKNLSVICSLYFNVADRIFGHGDLNNKYTGIMFGIQFTL